jgi:hypothetical protein
VDIDLVRASLALTPDERLARLDSDARFVAALRTAGRYPPAGTARRVAEPKPGGAG